ncbi:MAG: HupE/UreJ family protein [Microvirga sp.]|nr:HupE/UreJ family protein [Microvirga sp.]
MNRLALIAAAILAPLPALAHPGHHHEGGFAYGLLHPLTGLDHILAMVAVGIWAAMLGGRAVFALPAAFVATMVLAAGASMAGFVPPLLETGIALSVVALGAAVALGLRPALMMGAALCGVFAIFHGAAHGAELPHGADSFGYIAGFAIATALLHAAGIVLGMAIGRASGLWASRLAGAGVAAAGVFLLVG